MAEFTLDTSGPVNVLDPTGCFIETMTWDRLDAFTQAYVAALFHANFGGDLQRDGTWKMRVGFSDLAPETLAEILKDCKGISEKIGGALTADDGRRIWEHRQAGFPGPGRLDDELAAAFRPSTAYVGDDGKIYLREVK